MNSLTPLIKEIKFNSKINDDLSFFVICSIINHLKQHNTLENWHAKEIFDIFGLFYDDLELNMMNFKLKKNLSLYSQLTKSKFEEIFGTEITNISSKQILECLPKTIQKKFAMYYTKKPITQFITKLINSSSIKTVLDPACGDGRLLEIISKSHDVKIYGIDAFSFTEKNKIDGNYLTNVDFLQIDENGYLGKKKIFDDKFDLVITNPPYTRFSNLSTKYRRFLQSKFDSNLMSQMGLHGYFIIHLINFLKHDGILAAVLPASILFSQNTKIIRNFLLDNFSLKYVISYSSDNSFSDNSKFKEIILVAVRKNSEFNCNFISLENEINQKNFQQFASMITKNICTNKSINIKTISKNELRNSSNWLQFFPSNKSSINLSSKKSNFKLSKFKDIVLKIRRGTESFGPDFFYLPNKYWNIKKILKNQIIIQNVKTNKKLTIPSKFLISGLIRTNLYSKEIQPSPQEFFMSIPPLEIKDLPSSIQQYIEWGKHLDLAIKHNTFSQKKLWYSFLHSQLQRKSFFGNILLIRKLRLNTMGVIAHYFEDAIPASKAFYVIQCPKSHSKLIAAWLNSSFFLETMINFRRRISDNWGELMISDILELPSIIPTQIDETLKMEIHKIFDQLCTQKLSNINHQQKLKTKKNLDDVFSNLLQS